MGIARKARGQLSVVAALTAVVSFWAPAGGDAAAASGCRSFHDQAAAQTYFLDQGGSPRNGIGRLDPDSDGVACEGLGAPYQGYATLGYNKKRQFFYGVAAMPPLASAKGEFACLNGNRFEPDAARRVSVYKVKAGADVAVLGSRKRPAEPRPDTGILIWKAEKPLTSAGRYYVAFEAAVRTFPYGPTPCPEFRSRPIMLP